MTKNDIWLDTFIRCMAAQSASVDRFPDVQGESAADEWVLRQAVRSAKISAIYAEMTVRRVSENGMINNLGVFKGVK